MLILFAAATSIFLEENLAPKIITGINNIAKRAIIIGRWMMPDLVFDFLGRSIPKSGFFSSNLMIIKVCHRVNCLYAYGITICKRDGSQKPTASGIETKTFSGNHSWL